MPKKLIIAWLLIIILVASFQNHVSRVLADYQPAGYAQSSEVTAFDLIIAMNTLRMSNGLPALEEDPIINAVAQSTAEIMAANQMSSHIGDVRGRLAGAGYGGGDTVWGTENFAVGMSYSIDEIMLIWGDAAHMIPAVNPAYCHVGAGVAKSSNGRTYYVLQAAYVGGKACGEYKSVGGTTNQPGGSTGVSQIIVPVKIAAPDEDGRIYHVVEAGQSFWAIAVAYKITIRDLETWNNLSSASKLQIGQRLFIPGSNTEGYSTPTPVGMVVTSEPDREGKIIHNVQPYQTLTTIAQAYGVQIDTILALNGIQIDWPLQIGQSLLIQPSSATSTPPLSPIEMLTPESDGNYYHTVQPGETLLLIANRYDVSLNELMAWNGLNSSSLIYPEQKLLLQVTPPASKTPTPPLETPTATITPAPPTPTSSPALLLPTATDNSAANNSSYNLNVGVSTGWLVIIGLALGGLLLLVVSTRRPRE